MREGDKLSFTDSRVKTLRMCEVFVQSHQEEMKSVFYAPAAESYVHCCVVDGLNEL